MVKSYVSHSLIGDYKKHTLRDSSVEPQYDVVIVGGGPAGVIAAIGIARAGFQCLILDKKPRDKIGEKNCGDALDGKHTNILLEEMGISLPTVDSGEARSLIETITIASGSLTTKLSAYATAYQVDRLVYGQRLLQEAEEAGAIIQPEAAVRGVIIEEDQVRGVTYYQNQELHEVRAHITIDASGFIGVVRKEIPASMRFGVDFVFPKKYSVGTYREIVELKQGEHNFQNEIVLLYHHDIPPPGYAWIFTEGKNKLNIGITWDKSIPYPNGKSMKQIYHDILDTYIPPESYDVIYAGGGNISGMPNFDTLVVNGAMIVGDAGGLPDPTTYEGHGPALESGRLAADTAIDALKKGKFDAIQLWSYNKKIQSYPGGMHAQSFLVSQFIQEMGVDDFSYLLGKSLLTEEDLINIFQNKAPVTLGMKIRIFLRSFPKWGLMFRLRKVLDAIEKIDVTYQNYPDDPSDLEIWRKERNRVLGYDF
jgi:geranylgeranyl reductase family protein